MEKLELSNFKKIKELNSAILELWEKKEINVENLWIKTKLKIIESQDVIIGQNKIEETKIEYLIFGFDDKELWYLDTNFFKINEIEKLIIKWKKIANKRDKIRSLSVKRIIECYDKYGEKLSVMSYNRKTLERIMSDRNINVFKALTAFSMRNTMKTIAILTYELPEDVSKYEDVLKYQLVIHDYLYGLMPTKKSNIKEFNDEKISEEDQHDSMLPDATEQSE